MILEQGWKERSLIYHKKNPVDDFKSINSVLMDTYDMIEHLYTNKSEITGITTGFRDLNKKINGMQRTDLLLIAARPAMGKTAFSLKS